MAKKGRSGTSEDVILEAPMSFIGASRRIWRVFPEGWYWAFPAVLVIALALLFVACWYLLWGLWLVPYRLIRRGHRRRKLDEMRHRETLAMMAGTRLQPPPPAMSAPPAVASAPAQPVVGPAVSSPPAVEPSAAQPAAEVPGLAEAPKLQEE